MSFRLYDSEDDDIANAFDIFTEVFSYTVYFCHLFPLHNTSKGRMTAIQRLLSEKQGNHAKFLKVVNTITGEIAGHAIWLVFKNEKVPLADDFFDLEGDFWETEESKKQAQYAVHKFSEFRKNAINNADGNMLVLDVLAVAKKYQRQGVGRMLVQWGTTLADQLGYPAVVESSPEGRRLYESEGFQSHYKISILWPQKWNHLKEVELQWLSRPARVEQNYRLPPGT